MFTLDLKKFSLKFELVTVGDLDDVLQPYLDVTPRADDLFASFRLAIQAAVAIDQNKHGGADRGLIQAAWNRINTWAGVDAPKDTADHPLPGFGVKTLKAPKKAVPTTAPKKTYDVRLKQAVEEWITTMKKVCLASGADVTSIDWTTAGENLLALTDWRDEDGFVTHALEEVGRVDSSRVSKALTQLRQGPGLSNLLKKIAMEVEPGKEQIASGNVYGAFSEVVDLFFSLVRSVDLPSSRISAPSKNKVFTLDKVPLGGRIDVGALKEQDVDRTEILEGIKYYVEVKADVHTAVQKHSPGQQKDSGETVQFRRVTDTEVSDDEKFGTAQQLLRILAVVKHREGKVSTKPSALDIMERRPAVSILKSAAWLELFTSGTARVYVRLGFHLFMGDVRFTPQEMDKVATLVNQGMIPWCEKEASRSWSALAYREISHYRKLFFKTFETKFPPPGDWKQKLVLPEEGLVQEGLEELWGLVIS
ncbi:hypothetical protein [Corallococcus sicarius]|uniref:EH domain-containing protein n=1 Tax=Corallococcus sicarius TaxID=2316726 RepID=A0A3A8NF82_9BACT|nr:hypothetical protein [Corallococcus sicarius]RKH42663.1 hypothetical protein D7X12_15155 [Corallococcus sicarius]